MNTRDESLGAQAPYLTFKVMLQQAFGLLGIVLLAAGLAACDGEPDGAEDMGEADTLASATIDHEECDPDNGGIQLPNGFCAAVVADSVGPARHLVVRDNGDVYVKLSDAEDGGGIVALRDTDGDYRADETERFGDFGGTGIDIYDGHLYASSDVAVMRYALSDEALVPGGAPETILGEFPEQGSHAAKSFAIGSNDSLYVNVGAPSNACQQESRTAGSPGQDPCPQLEWQAGVWSAAADQPGQTQQGDAVHFATGIRNAVAIDWNPANDTLYVVQHGRDQLQSLWPDLYTAEENAELPSEEFFKLAEGSAAGWPYCYNDHLLERKVLAPEYGGDGEEIGRCNQFIEPIVAFPGHWAPNDLLFYDGQQFPERYQGGAFIAFHGSWNRAPEPQAGYRVTFVPFEGGNPSGEYETFADGFAGADTLESPGEARFRPMGLAQGPDGALYISDSVEGRIWRVIHAAADTTAATPAGEEAEGP